jgi:L-threonylcarbamoyladenylate synthase
VYYNWTKEIKIEELQESANAINTNGIVVFPTETVYGIGANALSKDAVAKIFLAKGRPQDNPLIVHLAQKEDITKFCIIQNEIEQKLIDAFMPGPFTLILKKKNIIPDIVSANLDTVGIRIPTSKIANELIKASNVPIAAPSANVSGRPSGTEVQDIKQELENKVDIIIDGGKTNIGLESTVVKVIDGIPTILRPGKITPEDIKSRIGIVKINDKIFAKPENEEQVESPGMKYRHYAPKTKCVLVDIEDEDLQIKKVNEIVSEDKNAVVIGFSEHEKRVNTKNFISMGSKDNLEEISQKLYSVLRKIDSYNVNLAIIEGVNKAGLGIAIMNRLLRACEFNVKK